MLTSLILKLKAPVAVNLPPSLGRAMQSLFYRLLDDYDPVLAATLHSSEGLKPYTVSNLIMGKRHDKRLHIEAEQEGWIRFTGLNEAISEVLLRLAQKPPDRIEIDGAIFSVSAATVNPAEHPWANHISYQDFAAPYLLGGQNLSPRIKLQFVSPTTFRSQKKFIPFPLPEQVFGGLLMRWQTFAPVALNPEVRRFAEEMLAVSRYDLQTVSLPYKQGGLRVGFVGEASFSALNRDKYWLSILHLLANFAFYSGVGYQSTTGLGQTRIK